MAEAGHEITGLLERWSDGDDTALRRLVELAYDDLRVIASRHVHRSPEDATLRTTALIHEAYLKLARVEKGLWASRGHFYAFCSKIMRHILIDYARQRQAAMRREAELQLPLSPAQAAIDAEVAEILAVEAALAVLAERDARLVRVVECRFFAALTATETAEALGVSKRTVDRDWTRARTYLHEILREGARRSRGPDEAV